MRTNGVISLSLFGAKPLVNAEVGRDALRSLLGVVPGLRPQAYFHPPGRRIRRIRSLESELASLTTEPVMFVVDGVADVESSGSVGLLDTEAYSHLYAEIPDEHLRDAATRSELLRIALALMVQVHGISGYCHDLRDFSLQNERNPGVFRALGVSLRGYRMKMWSLSREIDVERNPGHHHFVEGRMFVVAWANFFGPEMLKALGRDRVLAADWHSVEERDGHVMALLYPDPFAPDEDEKRKQQARVREQLALDSVAHAVVAGESRRGRSEISAG